MLFDKNFYALGLIVLERLERIFRLTHEKLRVHKPPLVSSLARPPYLKHALAFARKHENISTNQTFDWRHYGARFVSTNQKYNGVAFLSK